MSRITHSNHCAAVRYDTALQLRRKRHRVAGVTEPLPTCHWPPQNVQLLEDYFAWLHDTGVATHTLMQIYIPFAGHVLGLALVPHPQLDLDADFAKAMAFIRNSGYSVGWQKMCQSGSNYFRRFMRFERGLVEINLPAPADVSRYQVGLPDWLLTHIGNLQLLRQVNWRPTRYKAGMARFWSSHTVLWCWLFAQRGIAQVTDVRRQHLYDYIDYRLRQGRAVSSVNQELRCFQATLRFLQEHEITVPLALLRMEGLKQPDRLPRFLTDGQVGLLKDDFARRVATAETRVQKRDTLLDRAAFLLLWQAGLRVGEAEELLLDDIDWQQGRLIVRQGKGMQDRRVYLTAVTLAALKDYLTVRGEAHTAHLFIYRFKPAKKNLLRDRIKAAGRRVGVKVTPHRLRHTFATQLVNAGCSVMTIQKLLGHRSLQSTLVYTRVHDQTVAADYFKAMVVIEQRVGLSAENKSAELAVVEGRDSAETSPPNKPP